MKNPGLISLNADSFRVNEDTETVAIPIIRLEGTDGTVSVDYSVNSGTAIAGADFVTDSGTVVFAPGETNKEVEISLIDDNDTEIEEVYSFSIGNSIGTVLGDVRTANITIVDDDLIEQSAVVFDEARYKVDEDLGVASVTVTRTGDLNQEVSVDYYTSEDYARQGVDYLEAAGTLNFNAGEISKTFDISIIDDDLPEFKESFDLILTNPDRIALGVQNTTKIEIEDHGDTIPYHFEPEVVVSGLAEGETGNAGIPAGPTAFDWTPDGKTMLIAKLNGTVRVYHNEELQEQPFVDLSGEVNSAGQRGMLGLTIHPEFPEQPYVYLAFSYDAPDEEHNEADDAPRVTRLVRVTADPATNYTTAIPDSQVVLLETPPVNNFHAAGEIEFAPDGSLFFSHGDGAPVDGPATVENAQRLQSLDNPLGKLLRIDPITGEGYADNPFYDGDINSVQSKIYNYGLRNPWRYTFHPETGEPVIGDVGWTDWEEINTGRGQNFGWPLYEGGNGINAQTPAIAENSEFIPLYEDIGDVTAPIYAFNHSYGSRSINLGDFYTGELYPEIYQGAVFLTKEFIMEGDNTIYALLFDEEGNPDSVTPFAAGSAITQLAVGPDSHLYFSSLSTGEISRVTYPNSELELFKVVSVEVVPVEDIDPATEQNVEELVGIIYDTSEREEASINTKLVENVLDLGTDADFDNLVGFYEVIDMNGGIDLNGDNIADLFPADEGYAKAAIENRIEDWELRGGSAGNTARNTTAEGFQSVSIEGGNLYAPFIISNGGKLGFDNFIATEESEGDLVFNEPAANIGDRVAYFAFIDANPDGAKHMEKRGNNIFGFEDLPANLGVSDNDFDDAVFQFDFFAA